MENRKIEDFYSSWNGTSYEQANDCNNELMKFAELSTHKIKSYYVPIALDQDYANWYSDKDKNEYRYYDYSDVTVEDKKKVTKTNSWSFKKYL